ncbi:MAG: HD domain-containing protein [Roseburia sp.]
MALLLDQENYLRQLEHLEELEGERIFCKHGLEHLMDVARVAWIRCLEEHLPYDKEDVYLFALLHDIGRVKEIEEGISHAVASAQYAGEILMHIGYPARGRERIVNAILGHRGDSESMEDFAALMKWADKACRPCFCCKASEECNWKEEKKNKALHWQ